MSDFTFSDEKPNSGKTELEEGGSGSLGAGHSPGSGPSLESDQPSQGTPSPERYEPPVAPPEPSAPSSPPTSIGMSETSLPPWSERVSGEVETVPASASTSTSDSGSYGSFTSASLESEAGVDWGGAGSMPPLEPQETTPYAASSISSAETDFFSEPSHPQPRVRPGAGIVSSDRNLGLAVITGAVLIGIAWLAFALGEKVTLALITIVLVIGLAEFYTALNRVKYRPAALIGYAATVGLSVGVFWQGTAAYPIVLGLAFMFAMLWYLFGVSENLMLPDLAATFLGIAYVGVLGSFGALLLTFEDGVYLVVGAVIISVGYDIGGWVVGRLAGRTPLASVSPGKTVEGLVGGVLVSFLGAIILLSVFDWKPWVDPGTLGDRIIFAIFACLAAPLGDLVQSMLKRNLELKDMSSILPGHGGVLDRFDSLLFVLPTCYFVVRVTDLAVLA